jgi:hypothetical protein
MDEDGRIPPLSRRVRGATNWPKPPARATPPVLPDHVIDRLRARHSPTPAPEAPSEQRPVRVLWQAQPDFARSAELDTDEVTEPIPVISTDADIATLKAAPDRADAQPDRIAAQAKTVTTPTPPARLPQRVPGTHGPQPSPGRARQVTAPKRPARTSPLPRRTVRPDLLPKRPAQADPLAKRPAQADPLPNRPAQANPPPGARTSASDAANTTEPIPVIATTAAAAPPSPDPGEFAIEPGPPAPAARAAAIPADLGREANGPVRRVKLWRQLGTWLAGVPAAPELAGPTMLRPLFAESSTLEEMLASVRAQAEDQSVRAGRLRMIAIGLAVTVIVIILAVVFAM